MVLGSGSDPMDTGRWLSEYFRRELKTTFGSEPAHSDDVFAKNFAWHARKVPYVDEFAQAVLVELYFCSAVGRVVEEPELRRVLSRVRKRIRDELKRVARFDDFADVSELAKPSAPDNDLSDLMLALRTQLNIEEQLLLMKLLDGIDGEAIQKSLGISKSSYYRKKTQIYEAIKEYLRDE